MYTVKDKLEMTAEDRKALEADYAQGEVSRTEAARYLLIQRGSARLVNDLYRTEREQDQFIKEGIRLRLPGQRGYRSEGGIFGMLRSMILSLRG